MINVFLPKYLIIRQFDRIFHRFSWYLSPMASSNSKRPLRHHIHSHTSSFLETLHIYQCLLYSENVCNYVRIQGDPDPFLTDMPFLPTDSQCCLLAYGFICVQLFQSILARNIIITYSEETFLPFLFFSPSLSISLPSLP